MSTPLSSTAPPPEAFTLGIPVSKIDREQRLVSGILNEEILDKTGEVTDYPALKAALQATWPGNIREQHDAKKAVGTRTELVFEDDLRRAVLTAYVSKGSPDTWEKVLDGTLKGFSFAGTVRERRAEKLADGRDAKRLFVQAISEVSLVDNPACPTALFHLVKSVDGALVDAQPEEKTMANANEPTDTTAAADTTKSGPEPWDISQAADLIARMNSLLASELWAARQAEVDGDPALAATERAQAALLRVSLESLIAFLESETAEQFDTPGAAAGALELAVSGGDVQKRGARNSRLDAARIQKLHDTALELGAACQAAAAKSVGVAPETRAAVETSPVVPPPTTAAIEPVTTPPAPTPTPAETAVQKAQVEAPVPTAETAAAEAALPVEKVVLIVEESSVVKALQTDLTKAMAALADAATTLTEQKATIAAQAGSLAKLEERIVSIEAQPMPGGPVTRAVIKTLGGSDVAAPESRAADPSDTGDAVLKAYDTLALAAKTEDERLAFAQQKLAYIRRSSR